MATRIRLQRHGRKSRPIFHIVAADSRAKRDGRYIERIGIYNPNTNPATIDLNFDKAVEWVMTGAQPSDTVRAILSYKGVMMKKHLLEGVRKGALTEEQADEKFAAWLEDKENRINAKREGLTKEQSDARTKKLEAEAEVSKKRAEAIAAAKAEALAAAAPAEEATEEEVAEEAAAPEAAAETTEAAPAAEEKKEGE